MSTIAAVQNANIVSGGALPYRPVAVFVGGTAGIGAGMARAFAQHRKGDAHIIIIGRNRQAAQELIASFPKPAEGEPQHEFVECDVTLMRNVQQTTSELAGRLPKVNFLILSPGILTTKGRSETDEGIDEKLAIVYSFAGSLILRVAYGIKVQAVDDRYIAVAEEALHSLALCGNAGAWLGTHTPPFSKLESSVASLS